MYRIRTALLLTALTLALSGCSRQSEEPTSPAAAVPAPAPVREVVSNLLLICVDTVRADTFYSLGERRDDRLQAWQDDALVFHQAQSPAPWTVPALGSAFSGLWPIQHRAGQLPGATHVSVMLSRPGLMRKDTDTIAMAARNAGMATNVVSSSGWTFEAINGVGINHGFSEFHKFAPSLETLGDVYWEPMVDKWEDMISAQEQDERALNFVHFIEAHNWHLVTAAELDERIATFSAEQRADYRATAPERACADEASLMCRRYLVYAHAVGVLRDAVANMLDTLKSSGQLDNTAVVLFSDHGEEFNDHIGDGREDSKYRQEVFFGHGQSLYQEQLRVPLVVWHPSEEGRAIDTPVSLVDIAPSAAHWLGLELIAPDMAGELLHEQPGHGTAERVLYASNIGAGEIQVAARRGDVKSIWYIPSDRTAFYDLVQDPAELHSTPSNALVLEFDGYFLEHSQLQPKDESEAAKFTESQLKRLQSIGYLQGVDNAEAEEE
ncbi:MAG: sulfatase-like hydrolase/transferase [Halioglobus sp.]|nr:sulfatase-like hydrolase/transferase [Halioglobus sp.]